MGRVTSEDARLRQPGTGGGRKRSTADYRVPLLFCLVSSLVVLMAGELAVRVAARPDEDGNRMFGGRRLTPHRLPVRRVAAAVQRYEQAPNTMIVYDADLGWAPRPGAANAQAVHNSAGIRVDSADREFAITPDRKRIQLFGDSFAYGSEVGYRDTWGRQLEERLGEEGQPVDIMNFGVPGYGTDQAFLRWQKAGVRYSPHVVVFGLQLENLNRNVNLIRPLYIPSIDLPFSKPRFIEAGAGLQPINQPALPPGRLADTLARIESWDLREHEWFYEPERYRPRLWHRSKLLALLVPAVRDAIDDEPQLNELTPDKLDLGFRLLTAFEASVASHGARFVVVHLPRQSDLQFLRSGGSVPHADFLQRVGSSFAFIETIEALSRKAEEISIEALFRPGGHYAPEGNAVVADLVAHVVPERSGRAARDGLPKARFGRTPQNSGAKRRRPSE